MIAPKSSCCTLLIVSVFLLGVKMSNEDCLVCHEGMEKPGIVHEKVACQDCHTDIVELPHQVPTGGIDCLKCHSGMKDLWEGDPHLLARRKGNPNAPDCITCHGKHDLKTWKMEKGQTAETHRKSLQAFCSTCHTRVKAPEIYHLWPGVKNQECAKCHSDLSKRGIPQINFSHFRASVHGKRQCTECHRDVKTLPHKSPLKLVDCGTCHLPEYTEHEESIHGKAIVEGVPDAAHCWDCHGSHNVLRTDDRYSSVHPLNLPDTCGKCHARPEIAEKYKIPVKNPIALFKMSVHYLAVQQGKKSAVCNECHGVHHILPLNDPKSKIYKDAVPSTCGECHKTEYRDYTRSIHWTGYLKGVREAPVCNDCHQEHAVLPPSDPSSPVYAGKIPETCTRCHESEVITSRYEIVRMPKESYYASYHGLALKAGKLTAANCASCHKAHDILPPTDPASSVHPANLATTCGSCHPGIGTGMTPPRVHGEAGATPVTPEQYPPIGEIIISWVRKFYLFLISIVISVMAIHNILHFRIAARRRKSSGL